jgi:hypothetical protein
MDDHLVEPNSALGKAIVYMQSHWETLTRFLSVPGAPLDNNLAERVLKKPSALLLFMASCRILPLITQRMPISWHGGDGHSTGRLLSCQGQRS